MVACRAAAAILASSSALNPVVPSTCTIRALAASAAKSSDAAGTVKSSTASALANSSGASSVMTTPSLPRPASRPASWPRAREPSCSAAPISAHASLPWTARISSRPMRPAAPMTAIFILLIRPASDASGDIAARDDCAKGGPRGLPLPACGARVGVSGGGTLRRGRLPLPLTLALPMPEVGMGRGNAPQRQAKATFSSLASPNLV